MSQRITPKDVRKAVERLDPLLRLYGLLAADATLTYSEGSQTPLARGGRHSIGDLLPACQPCNASKHTKFLIEWLPTRKKALL